MLIQFEEEYKANIFIQLFQCFSKLLEDVFIIMWPRFVVRFIFNLIQIYFMYVLQIELKISATGLGLE